MLNPLGVSSYIFPCLIETTDDVMIVVSGAEEVPEPPTWRC